LIILILQGKWNLILSANIKYFFAFYKHPITIELANFIKLLIVDSYFTLLLMIPSSENILYQNFRLEKTLFQIKKCRKKNLETL
jgi:hypothetical protein